VLQLCYITKKQPKGCDTQLAQTGRGKCLGVMSRGEGELSGGKSRENVREELAGEPVQGIS